ncbi:MAG: TauD/TfdA family dioxygenase [Aliidongia sp.]
MAVERELIDGRGFVRIAALDTARYSDDDLTLLYWGIGTHLGDPWPQNKHGHVMGDVTDQGRQPGDPEARGNELGLVGLGYHTDGSDLVGLMCLRPAKSGGLSCVANVVAIYNDLLDERPGPDRGALRGTCPGICAASRRRAARPGTRAASSPSMMTGCSSASSRNTSSLAAPSRCAAALRHRDRGARPRLGHGQRPALQRLYGSASGRDAVHQQLPCAARPQRL